jgi:MFS family permease
MTNATVAGGIPTPGQIHAPRQAGASQALLLIASLLLPILAIITLAPNLPQLMRHFADVPNASYLVPLLITMPGIGIALFAPLMGAVADKWGRRPVLLGALLMYSCFGVLPLMLTDLTHILVSRAFLGVAEAAIMATVNPLFGDYFEEVPRNRWLGYNTIVGTVMGSTLTIVSGALATISWQAPFALYLLGLPLFAWGWFALWEPKRATAPKATMANSPPAKGFPWKAMVVLYAVTLFGSTVFYLQAVQLGRIFNAMGADSPANMGLAIAIGNLGTVLSGFIFFRLSKRPVPILMGVTFLIYGTGFVVLGSMTSWQMAIPVVFWCQIANGLLIPGLVAWGLSTLSPEHRGRGMGLWASCFFAGQFTSPIAVAFMSDVLGGLLAAVIGFGVACLIAATIAWILGRVRARNVTGPASVPVPHHS